MHHPAHHLPLLTDMAGYHRFGIGMSLGAVLISVATTLASAHLERAVLDSALPKGVSSAEVRFEELEPSTATEPVVQPKLKARDPFTTPTMDPRCILVCAQEMSQRPLARGASE